MTEPQQPDSDGTSTNGPSEDVTKVVGSPAADAAIDPAAAQQPPYPAPGQPGYPPPPGQPQVPVPPGMAAQAQQPQYGQVPQPQYGQGPQPQYAPPGAPPYGQAPYGQAPYGQAPYGQAPYGQPGGPGQPQPGQQYPGAPFGPPPGGSAGSRRGLTVVLGALGALILVGGLLAFTAFVAPGWAPKKLSQQGAQNGVSQILTKNYQVEKLSNVNCPAGQRVKKGASFDCTVTVEGRQQKVTLTFIDNKGGFEVGAPH